MCNCSRFFLYVLIIVYTRRVYLIEVKGNIYYLFFITKQFLFCNWRKTCNLLTMFLFIKLVWIKERVISLFTYSQYIYCKYCIFAFVSNLSVLTFSQVSTDISCGGGRGQKCEKTMSLLSSLQRTIGILLLWYTYF